MEFLTRILASSIQGAIGCLLLNVQPLVKSLSSALHLLGFFTSERREWRVTELAKKAGLHKSQVSRVLRTFEAYGFVERDSQKRSYRIGRAFQTYAGLVRTDEELLKVAHPIMETLNKQTQGTILLKVRDGGESITIERVESQHFLRLAYPVGLRLPLNASSSGKVFLAYMPRDEVKKLHREGFFRKFTTKTKTDFTALERDLIAVRRRGFALSDGEHLLGARAVAAPIFGSNGVVVASLGLGLPDVLFPKDKVEELGRAVRRAAKEMSILLGYRPGENSEMQSLGRNLRVHRGMKGDKNEKRQRT